MDISIPGITLLSIIFCGMFMICSAVACKLMKLRYQNEIFPTSSTNEGLNIDEIIIAVPLADK